MRSLRSISLAAALCLVASSVPFAADKPAPETADSLYNQGNDAYDRGDYSLALQLYTAAFNLRKSYDIARNLGLSELKLGKLRDAIGHFQFSLAQYPSNRADTKKQVTEWLAQAQKEVGTIKLTVDPEAATCSLNGVALTREERGADIPADPGDNLIECSADGFLATKQTTHVAKGAAETVEITLKKSVAAVNPPPTSEPPKPQLSAYHRAFGYDTRLKIAWTGVGLASLLVAGAAVSGGISLASTTSAEGLRDDLRTQTGRDFPCAAPATARCDELLSTRQLQDLTGNLAFWTFISGAAVGGFTMAYLWPPDGPSTAPRKLTPAPEPAKLKVVGSIAPGGVVISGSF